MWIYTLKFEKYKILMFYIKPIFSSTTEEKNISKSCPESEGETWISASPPSPRNSPKGHISMASCNSLTLQVHYQRKSWLTQIWIRLNHVVNKWISVLFVWLWPMSVFMTFVFDFCQISVCIFSFCDLDFLKPLRKTVWTTEVWFDLSSMISVYSSVSCRNHQVLHIYARWQYLALKT